MEEQREESASLGDSRVPLEESGKELGLASKTETLDPSIKDANAVGVLDSGVCDVSEADENPNGGGVEGDVEKGVSSDSVVIKTDALAETETERGQMESGGDADVKPLNGESHEGGGEEGTVNSVKDKVTDEEANKLSVAEEAGQEKESAGKSDEDNTNKEQVNEEENVEAKDAKHSKSVQVPEVTNEEAPGTVLEVSPEEDTTTVNHEEENGEAMDIDYTEEETVEKVVLDDAGNESSVASVVPTQDVTVAEADRDDSNVVKEMEVDNSDMASELTGTVGSTDSANPKVPTEDAAPGEVEPLDHNGLFDPRSDITSYIDFSGVSSWSGNVQDLKTETGDVSLKEADKGTEVATAGDKLSTPAEGVENESNEAPVEASDAIMGSDENQEEKDPQDTRREEDGTTHEAPSNDQHQKEDTVMEENQDIFDYADVGTDSDPKANGLKRKADVLNEDSLGEGKKNVSFKIGACIARAASQMAGTPSVLKGSSNLGDETLSVESFVSQLHSAATDPVKENLVSELATGFFLDFRNSSASQQFVPEKTSSKRAKQSNSNAGGTEAFEFEEMGDTYWTDRVIHNGGEEQTTPATEKENYQVVPVELKPAQVKRTRRPYRRRQSQISYPLPSASDKPADFDENAPAELIMYFSETDTIPSEKSLNKMFRHFGPIRDSQTEVDEEKHRARVVFRKGADAGVAYKSAGSFNIFGTKTVNYELSFTITETFKVQPYVVSLGEEVAAAEGGVEEAAVVSIPTETFKDQPYVVSLGEEEVAPAVEGEEVAAAAVEGGEEEATVVSLPSETFKDQPYVESLGEEVAPAVEGEEVAPAVEGEEVAPAVEGEEVAPAVEGKEVAPAVAEGGEEEAAAVSLPS